jgi:hypothetical protein
MLNNLFDCLPQSPNRSTPLPPPEFPPQNTTTALGARGDDISIWWSVTGWSNPDCEGVPLWTYAGAEHTACFDFPLEAASVSCYQQQSMQYIFGWVTGLCPNKPGTGTGRKRRVLGSGGGAADADAMNGTVVRVVEGPVPDPEQGKTPRSNSTRCEQFDHGVFNLIITVWDS